MAWHEVARGGWQVDEDEGLLGSRLGATLWADAETSADSSVYTMFSVWYLRYCVLATTCC